MPLYHLTKENKIQISLIYTIIDCLNLVILD